eukprot:NODE_5_length_49639_cov_0.484336.p21 type:complete len:173 gc:universal NODE_5_length_49639_cov_0.484336:25077-25595(+)
MSKSVTITNLPMEISEQDITSTCEEIAGNVVNIRLFQTFAVVEFQSNRLTNQLKDVKLLDQTVKVYHRKNRGMGDLKYVLQVHGLPKNTEWKLFFNYIKFAGQVDNLFMSIDGTKSDVIFTSRSYMENARNYLYLVPFTYTNPEGEEVDTILESVKDTVVHEDAGNKKRRIN